METLENIPTNLDGKEFICMKNRHNEENHEKYAAGLSKKWETCT